MTEQPTDWIQDAGWVESLYGLARQDSRTEFDAMLRRLLYEHGANVAAAPDALRVRIEALAASIEALTGRSSDYDDAIDDVLDLVRALLEDGAQ